MLSKILAQQVTGQLENRLRGGSKMHHAALRCVGSNLILEVRIGNLLCSLSKLLSPYFPIRLQPSL